MLAFINIFYEQSSNRCIYTFVNTKAEEYDKNTNVIFILT